MIRAIVKTSSGQLCGFTDWADYVPATGCVIVDLPQGYTDDMADLLVYQNGQLSIDQNRLRDRERETVRAKIKAEAGQRISDTDWRLERAREREYLGTSGLTDVDTVLSEREAIRQTSNAIEMRLDALDDVEAVRAFAWTFDGMEVKVPSRMTRKKFLDRFTPEEMATIMAASDQSPAIKAWLITFQSSELIDLGDPTLAMGIGALEMSGLLPEGRAAQVLAR